MGTGLEGWGIIIVSGRENEVLAPVRKLRAHTRDRHQDLVRYTPAPTPIPWLSRIISGAAQVAARSKVSVGVEVTPSPPPKEFEALRVWLGAQVTALRREADEQRLRMDSLMERLPADIRDATVDPWRGLKYLGIGLGCLLVAGVWGAFR